MQDERQDRRTPEGVTTSAVSRRLLITSGLAGAAVVAFPKSMLWPASGLESTQGSWGPRIALGGTAIHLVQLHDGQVLFFQYVEGNPSIDHTSLIRTFDLSTGTTESADASYRGDLFCAGMNQLPDGRVFVVGGHSTDAGQRRDPVGVATTDLFDPMTRMWTPGPQMSEARWYPTALSLGNGRSLIMGGSEKAGTKAHTVDEYDPESSTMQTLPSSADKALGMYRRAHLLEDGRVVISGPPRASIYFDPSTAGWESGPPMKFGTRQYGGAVLMPGATGVLAFGGRRSANAPATTTAEILDSQTATWSSVAPMNVARIHANGVLLPDGTLLVIGGGAAGNYVGPVKAAELYNPATNTWTLMAAQQAQRMYHSTAILLPDGRVMSAGSDSGGDRQTAEIFSPPYLFMGARPVISQAPASMAYGDVGKVESPDLLSKIVLVRPGSVTHQIDTDQRLVPLAFTGDSVDGYSVDAPVEPNLAPPGYYMLFVLDAAGVPSVASWVHLGA